MQKFWTGDNSNSSPLSWSSKTEDNFYYRVIVVELDMVFVLVMYFVDWMDFVVDEVQYKVLYGI